jgi:uncharacterized membrane protein YfcA
MNEVVLLMSAIAGGFLGSILGLGGGIIMVPVLTLYFQINIRYAIAASLVSIVATSSGAAVSFLRESLTNLRLAVVLELATVLGAIVGFIVAASVKPQLLFLFFGIFLVISALLMLRQREERQAIQNHPWAKSLKLNRDNYLIENIPCGLFLMFLAGITSALLGIGSGIFKVLALDSVMKLPLKVSSATSNFMIGVTASASAGAYFLKGDIRPEIAAPVAVGILVGSFFGAKAMLKIPAVWIRRIFVVVLGVTSIQMIFRGLN